MASLHRSRAWDSDRVHRNRPLFKQRRNRKSHAEGAERVGKDKLRMRPRNSPMRWKA